MAAKKQVAQPVDVIDNSTRRNDDDAVQGSFVDVVAGEHEGRRGSFEHVVTYNDKDGYPETVLIRSRDQRSEPLVVNYKDVRPASGGYFGGR